MKYTDSPGDKVKVSSALRSRPGTHHLQVQVKSSKLAGEEILKVRRASSHLRQVQVIRDVGSCASYAITRHKQRQASVARIAGVDLPREKRVEVGLTYVYGIGRSTAKKIVARPAWTRTRGRDMAEARSRR